MPRGGPYFGSTGGPIQVPDYSGIAKAAQIEAAGYDALGRGIGQGLSAIGQGIEKYGLMKEQQKKDKGFLKGAIAGIKSFKEGDPNPQNDMMYDAIIAGAEDENIPLVQRVAQMKQGQQQINLTGQQQMQQSLISSRQATEEAQRQRLELIKRSEAARKALNMSLLHEQREAQNTLATLSPEDRANTTLTGRAKWVMNLPEPVLESSALPMNMGIYDPEAARIRDLQMGLNEFKFGQAVAGEEAFPTSVRAGLEREGKETDIGYKKGMTKKLTAGIPRQEAIAKRIAEIDSEAKSILSGAAWAKDDEGNSLKLEDFIEYDPITEGIVLSEKATGFASQDFDRLKHLVQEKGGLRLDQKIRVVMTDGTTKEMTGREYQKLKAEKADKDRRDKEARRRPDSPFGLQEIQTLDIPYGP
jgi:hypothetical protein